MGQQVVEQVQSASEQIVGTPQGSAESISSKVKATFADAASSASSAVAGTEPDMIEKVSSRFSEASMSASKGVTAGTPAPAYEDLSSKASEGVASMSSGASSAASKAGKVFSGAMAQKVGQQKPILDDDLVDDERTYSEKLQNIVEQAGDKYADITKAVNEAMLGPTSTQGSVESMTSLASEQYSSALAAASSVLYGTQQGTVESLTSMASGKYADAVAA